MLKVAECVAEIPTLFDALFAGDDSRIKVVADQISGLENDADTLKNDIRTNLPKTVFLSVDRGDLLTLLNSQDSVADACEDLGILLTMRTLNVPESLSDPLHDLVDRAMETARLAIRLLEELDELVEASFGGVEATRVAGIINDLGEREHLADRAQWEYARQIFLIEKELTAGELWMFLKLGETLGYLANSAENVGKRLQLMLRV